ncbi:MAG: lamin tail domain-containing protein [Microbacterium sp.]|uniref:lamin tail domain-containing protein n=1 Tax=Microbacterium sp. TaxID=51671 RepID=UPI0039E5A904
MRISSRPFLAVATVAALTSAGVVALPVAASAASTADVRITEFAYGGLIADSSTGGDGEYVEITNLGDTSVDMSGWSYNTSSTAGGVDLSDFGTLAPGESAIVTDVTPAEFRADWGLTDAVAVVNDGSVTLNKGPKTLFLFDADATVVDSVSYVSGFFDGKGQSAWVDAAHVGAMSGTTGWTHSTLGDDEDSWTSAAGSIGSPGISSLAALSSATANVKITEFAYGGLISGSSTGGDGEYVEVTNVGRTPVDMTGWSYNTADSASGAVSLSGLGTLAPGESALVTDVTPDELRTDWGLSDAVKIVNDGSVTLNKGPKTIYLLDATDTAVDSVSYASGFLSGKGLSAWVDAAHLGAMSGTTGWTVSAVGDQEDSWTSATGAVGSPGASTFGIHTAAFVQAGTDGDDDGSTTSTDPNYADIVINEISSDNSDLGYAPLPSLKDGIELYNTGDEAVSLEGWKQIDSGSADSATVFSDRLYVDGVLATTIPAHGYGVFQSGAGLSSGGDSVKIYTADGTLVDQVDYEAGQAGVDETVNTDGTYQALAACPDGSDTFLEVTTASFGASNEAACATGVTPLGDGTTTEPEAACDTEDAGDATGTVPDGTVAWPGSAEVSTIDTECEWVTTLSGQDLSGLAFDPNDSNVLYAVKNKSHVWRLVKDENGDWVKDTTDGWSDGKDIRFPDGSGLPDSEGLTVGSDGMLYITTERDNADSSIPLDSILQFDPNTSDTTISATNQWVLTSDLGFTADDSADANLGFEGVAYVPDSELVAQGFRTDDGELYDPADYPDKVTDGVFFGAIEKNGHLHAYVLDADGGYERLADVDSGLAGVMDAAYDADLGAIWAHCDNTCDNTTAVLAIGDDGHFAVETYYDKPAGLPNYNLEGFAVAPASTAVDGQRQVLWTDDGNRYGHSLWAGTLPVDLGADYNAALTTTTATVHPGDQITVTASGLTAGEEYTLTLHSDPVILGTAVAASDGTLTLTGLVPMSTTIGSHTITIALSSNPSATLTSLALEVTAAATDTAAAVTTTSSGSLASTGGADWRPWGVGAGILALLGAGLVLTGRRLARRSA